MKGNIVFIIGGAVVIGVAAYVIYKHLQSQAEDQPPKNTILPRTDEPVGSVSDFTQTKEDAATAIKNRHTDAAQTINMPLQTIFNEDKAGKVDTENSKSLNKIDDELNNLLK